MNVFSIVGKIAVNCADAIKNIDKVSKSAKTTAEGLEDVDKKASDTDKSVKDVGKSAKEADTGFSTWKATLANLAANAITKVVSGCANLAKSVIDLGTDFTATMSEVKAISGASDEQMKQLEATAREFGATTVFSATDAAEALKYMSLAGWSVEESTSALGGVLDLAAASGMELGKASDMVTDYLSAFGMEADQAAYFADMLAYAQSNSNTTAEQLGEAYRNCAANLNAAGQDVETTTSLLEAMANQGYKGSEAGTALAAIMRDITNAMKDGSIQIGETTVSVMDAQGNFRDLTDILTDVENATNGMGDAERAAALSSTFTADSTKGLNLILNEGMGNIAGYEEALRSSNGAASEMAATMNDNLKGDLANLNSAFEELKLKIFDGAESPMRSVVQFTTSKVIPAVTNLVENLDTVLPILGGMATAFGVLKVEMAISGLISSLSKAWTAYKAKTEGATVAQFLFNEVLNASPIMLIVSLIAGLVVAIVALWNTNEDFRNKVIEIWNNVKETISSVIDSIKQFFTDLGESIGQAWETIKNIVTVGIMLIAEIISTYIQIVTLPWRFLWENCKEYLVAAWEFIKNAVSTALDAISNVISTVWNAITNFLNPIIEGIKNAFVTAWNAIKNVTTTVWNAIKSVITTVINGIKSVITTVLNAVKSVVTTILNVIKNVFTTVWNGVKSVVSSAINSIKSVITSGLNAAKSAVTSVLNGIKSAFTTVWDGCKNVVSNAIDKIKSVMNFSWSLPKLKLPHFKIDGSFSLNPPSVPHFSIDWYKKAMDAGMIMNEPTIFGYNPKTNSFLAGGEAGSETVVGTESLMSMINAAVQQSGNDSEVSDILRMMFVWMKNGGLMNMMIDVLTNYVEFDIDGREVGRLVKKYA